MRDSTRYVQAPHRESAVLHLRFVQIFRDACTNMRAKRDAQSCMPSSRDAPQTTLCGAYRDSTQQDIYDLDRAGYVLMRLLLCVYEIVLDKLLPIAGTNTALDAQQALQRSAR